MTAVPLGFRITPARTRQTRRAVAQRRMTSTTMATPILARAFIVVVAAVLLAMTVLGVIFAVYAVAEAITR